MISNKEIKAYLDALDRKLDLMDRSLILHNPGGQRAAEMFDGLRKTVIRSLNTTQVLQAGLAQLDQISAASDDIQDVRVKLKELMDAASMRKVHDFDLYREAFEILGTGPVESVARPAYVTDTSEGVMVVIRGVVELSEPFDPPPPPHIEEMSAQAVDDASEERPSVADDTPDNDKDRSDEVTSPLGDTK